MGNHIAAGLACDAEHARWPTRIRVKGAGLTQGLSPAVLPTREMAVAKRGKLSIPTASQPWTRLHVGAATTC